MRNFLRIRKEKKLKKLLMEYTLKYQELIFIKQVHYSDITGKIDIASYDLQFKKIA